MRNAEINRGEFYEWKTFSKFEIPRLSVWESANLLWPFLKTGAASLRACEFAEQNAIQYRNQDSIIRGRMTPNVRR
jgi:hypothetical protein